MLTNDLPSLNERLAVALHDPTYGVWGIEELDDLLIQSIDRLWPHVMRQIDPDVVASEVALVAGTYFYTLPVGMQHVWRVDWVDSSGEERGPLPGGSWELVGEFSYSGPAPSSYGKIHVSPTFVDQLGTLRLNGAGRYDAYTNLIPNDVVQLVISMARAEAYRRIGVDRGKFETWLSRNQTQNVSVNELLQLIREASMDVEAVWRRTRTMQRPVPGRVK
jgi:hypothetical protein